MKSLALVFIFLTSGCGLLQKVNRVDVPPTVPFSRYLMISTCYQTEKVCREPVAKNLETANTSSPFKDGVAQNTVSVTEEGQIFTGDITFTAKEDGFQIELKLHSGNTQKRTGEKVSVWVKDLNHLEETVVIDKPIAFRRGMLRAQLVFGPVLNITK